MPIYEMPRDTSEKSKYANEEPEYENKSVMLTSDGKKVTILNYQHDKGLYVVMNFDEPGTRSPAYRISPDKLRKIEKENIEHIPTSEEVLGVIKEIIGKNAYEKIRELSDEKGLYLLEVKTTSKEGEPIEYGYMRKMSKGTHEEGSITVTEIHVTYFDDNGVPISGHSIAKLVDGKWKDTV